MVVPWSDMSVFLCLLLLRKNTKIIPCRCMYKDCSPLRGKKTKKRKCMLGASREEGKEGEKFAWMDYGRVKSVNPWRGEQLEYRVRG